MTEKAWQKPSGGCASDWTVLTKAYWLGRKQKKSATATDDNENKDKHNEEDDTNGDAQKPRLRNIKIHMQNKNSATNYIGK